MAVSWALRVQARLGSLELDVDVGSDVDVTAIVGPNGSGKTTLLRCVAGALTPAAGHIEVGGHCLFDSAAGLDVPIEHRRVAYVPQGHGLFPHLDVLDNVAFGLSTRRGSISRSTARRRALEMLDELGCRDLGSRRPSTLSGGESQRVALARALVVEPRVLLLDEPLAALDASSRRRTRRFLAEHLRRVGRPSIVVTHDVRDVRELDAHVHVVERGRIVQSGSLDHLARAPVSEFVAELVGE